MKFNPIFSYPTRFPELNYRKNAPAEWRIIDCETGSEIGPIYPTKAELFGDLGRYAQDFGCVEQG